MPTASEPSPDDELPEEQAVVTDRATARATAPTARRERVFRVIGGSFRGGGAGSTSASSIEDLGLTDQIASDEPLHQFR
ncbi:hypothetical protein JCM9957A_65410 [Kineosporia succinea]